MALLLARKYYNGFAPSLSRRDYNDNFTRFEQYNSIFSIAMIVHNMAIQYNHLILKRKTMK